MPGVKVFRYVSNNHNKYKGIDDFNADIDDYVSKLPHGLKLSVKSHLSSTDTCDTIVVVVAWNNEVSNEDQH